MKKIAATLLAAGKSTRMKSDTSKVLHNIMGRPAISYPISELLRSNVEKIAVVIREEQKTEFEEKLSEFANIQYCIQKEALGTGDAVLAAESELKDFDGYVLILPGDVPLISSKIVDEFVETLSKSGAELGVITTEWPDPQSYGRIIRDEVGEFVAIREVKDASDEEKDITEINTGIFLVDSKLLFSLLKEIKPHNAQKEYYLTDIVELAIKGGKKVIAHCMWPHEQFIGINDRFDLEYATKMMQVTVNTHWMENGVTLVDSNQIYIDSEVEIGRDTYISPFVFLKGKTTIGENCIIDAGAYISDTEIGDNVHVKPYTVMEKGCVKGDSEIGPFARIRPDTILEKNVKVGNFVEVKKSLLRTGVKASHLSYIGDAEIGVGTNVGCGTITCNYDGKKKHKTTIGENVLIGSDTQFVAPVEVGDNAVIGAGSTITKNVPADSLALSRVEQKNIKDWVTKKNSK